jgi:flavin-dependent dehydrogenase
MYSDGVILCGDAAGIVSSMYIGVPPVMLSGMLAAEAVEWAKKRGDFSKKTLSKYAELMKDTSIVDMLKKAKKQSNYLIKKGRSKIPIYRDTLSICLEKWLENETTFLSKQKFPVMKLLYKNIISNFCRQQSEFPSI